MLIRKAHAAEIDRLIWIRGAVRENRLRDPASVTREDYAWFVGMGLVWVAEIDGKVVGFSAADPRDGTIWALFLDPASEGAGLGAKLLALACADLRASGHATARLGTDADSKAARLYRKLGWEAIELSADGELAFQLVLS
jgi:GNAT superfamily N-acetyltransferase